SVIEKECTEMIMRKGSSEKKYDVEMQKILFGVMRQEKTLVRLEIIRGVISIERARKVADLTGKKKEAKKVIQDPVDLAQSRFLEHIWKFRCKLTAKWEEKESITKDNKRKPKEAEKKAKTDLVKKRRKGKEKQTPYSEAGASNPQPERSTRRAEREANKENQDPQREGNGIERKKREKKKEAKIEIVKIHTKSLESRIKGGTVPGWLSLNKQKFQNKQS
ncbi:11004_t:CDS:1, partial [Gigaspora rosea]